MIDLRARFRYLDVGVYEARALVSASLARKVQWKRRARQAQVDQAGVCTGRTTCFCPNCTEKNQFWTRVHRLVEDYGVGSKDAFARVSREITGGIVPTPWSDVAGTYGERYDDGPRGNPGRQRGPEEVEAGDWTRSDAEVGPRSNWEIAT